MSDKLSTCCDASPIGETDLCGDCKEHTTFYYPKDSYLAGGYGSCDHCGRVGYVNHEMEVSYNDQGEAESEEPLTSLCAECGDK